MGAGATTAIIAAQAAMAAASSYSAKKAGNVQATVSKAEATLTHAQQEFELSRKAAVETEEYRRNLATAVASASSRGGAGMARQFGGQYAASYSQDIEAINRAYKINDVQKLNKEAQANAIAASTSQQALLGFGQSILGASAWGYEQGLFGKTTREVSPTSNVAGTVSGKFDPLG
jgi:hypothetical protein